MGVSGAGVQGAGVADCYTNTRILTFLGVFSFNARSFSFRGNANWQTKEAGNTKGLTWLLLETVRALRAF